MGQQEFKRKMVPPAHLLQELPWPRQLTVGYWCFPFSPVLRLVTSAAPPPFVPSQNIANNICIRTSGSLGAVLRPQVLVRRAQCPPSPFTSAKEVNFLGSSITHSWYTGNQLPIWVPGRKEERTAEYIHFYLKCKWILEMLSISAPLVTIFLMIPFNLKYSTNLGLKLEKGDTKLPLSTQSVEISYSNKDILRVPSSTLQIWTSDFFQCTQIQEIWFSLTNLIRD